MNPQDFLSLLQITWQYFLNGNAMLCFEILQLEWKINIYLIQINVLVYCMLNIVPVATGAASKRGVSTATSTLWLQMGPWLENNLEYRKMFNITNNYGSPDYSKASWRAETGDTSLTHPKTRTQVFCYPSRVDQITRWILSVTIKMYVHFVLGAL